MQKKKKWIREGPPYLKEYDIEIDPDTYLNLTLKRRRFEDSQNSVYALEAFLISLDSGLYPPQWVITWLSDAFRKYHESNGCKDLDGLLGFRFGKGQDSAFKKAIVHDRDDLLLLDVARLKAKYDLSLEKAGYMVFRRLEETPNWEFQFTGIRMNKISERRIQDLYLASPIWKKVEEDFRNNPALAWTDKKKKEYLKLYPEDSLPPKLQP